MIAAPSLRAARPLRSAIEARLPQCTRIVLPYVSFLP
jgi:hypothetical protein